jgi:hypothetical protein
LATRRQFIHSISFASAAIAAPSAFGRTISGIPWVPEGAILIAGQVSRGGSFQTRIESAIGHLARRCGLSAAFQLCHSGRWGQREKLAELKKVQNLHSIGFFKLVPLRPLGKQKLERDIPVAFSS